MSENVIPFHKRAEKFSEDTENHVCLHCEFKHELIEEVLGYISENEDEVLSIDELIGHFMYIFDSAYDEGKRDAFSDIMGYSQYSIEQTFETHDEE